VTRLINELVKTLNDNSIIVLTPQKTVVVYKLFSVLLILMEKSNKRAVRNILRDKYQEEFK
jgi:hypothetical protein